MGLQLRFRARLLRDRLKDLSGVELKCTHNQSDDRPSPHVPLRFAVGGEDALLCYGQPSVRDRVIFGALVPWGELWRTGANEATLLALPFRALVAGIELARGRYSIYSIPSPDSWMVVINRSIRQSGRTRDEVGPRGNHFSNAYVGAVARSEIGRRVVPTRSCDFREQLTITPVIETPDRTVLAFEWERCAFDVPIERRG